MLTEAQRSIIRATVPALQNHGEAITQHFYTTLFNSHPELLNIFNKANQRPGGQSANLATSILMYAGNIDHLTVQNGLTDRPQARKYGSKARALSGCWTSHTAVDSCGTRRRSDR